MAAHRIAADPATGAHGRSAPVLCNVTLRAKQGAIRAALMDLRDALVVAGLDGDACGTVEITLAEALNNIAEHAYGAAPGDIRLRMTAALHTATGGQAAAMIVDARLIDMGAPLPGCHLPAALLPLPGDGAGTLPEGGYGWFLIHSLTERLTYTRQGTENHLHLHFAFPPPPSTQAGRHKV